MQDNWTTRERNTMQDTWTTVDTYIYDVFETPDPQLEAALKSAEEAGLPPISVAPNQGKLLSILAMSLQAHSILEIGTLGGYSTIWLARSLPHDGKLLSLEVNPKHAEVARANIERAGLSGIVEIQVGAALDTLQKLVLDGHAPFDLVFIDADKENYPGYLEWTLKLVHKGSLIIADNIVRNGAVADATSPDMNVSAVRRFNAALAAEPRLAATVYQSVSIKGYDGMALAYVVSD